MIDTAKKVCQQEEEEEEEVSKRLKKQNIYVLAMEMIVRISVVSALIEIAKYDKH